MNKDLLFGCQVPNFKVTATSHLECSLADFLGKNIVFFFYPKDNTPVCTSEAKAFRDNHHEFKAAQTLVFGISRDTLASHERFKTRLELPFELISDTHEELCHYFDVIKMKNFFGKQIRGIVRSTFILDKQGIVRHAWRKIKLAGHIQEVIAAVNTMK
jgi:thioredoxin-dependent peroxiredoxin